MTVLRNSLLSLMLLMAVFVSSAPASDVGFNFGINIGNLPQLRVPLPPLPPLPPRIMIDAVPDFIALPGLGFSAAVGVPYDIFNCGDSYYLIRDNTWYRGPRYSGPWVKVGYGSLPWQLRRYPVERIRYVRDNRYHTDYDDNRDWREHRREHDRERWERARDWDRDRHRYANSRWRHGDDD